MGKEIKVGINGFGRIGRLTLRALLKKKDINVVMVNDLTDIGTLAHLFKYDTAHGMFRGEVTHDDKDLIVDQKKIKVSKEKDPTKLDWGGLGVDIVLEATGKFKKKAEVHLDAGAKKVVVSAYASKDVKTIVIGVNDDQITPEDKIVSNASCTTNCLAPMVKVLDDHFGVEYGQMTTVHAYTSSQSLHDAPHKDLRRSRAAAVNIIPTTTSAAKAIDQVLPHLKGRLTGMAMRVPVLTGSITDLNAVLKNKITEDKVNGAMKEASQGAMKNILQYTEAALVSSDIVSNPHSCIYDATLTNVLGDHLIKIFGWYDNESGYANRCADLIEKMGTMA